MSLQLHVPHGTHTPSELTGTIDGSTPARFQADRATWVATFGAWSMSVAADHARTSGAVRAFLYQAVARYRDAQRTPTV
jgi:hypothetical protein